MLDWIDRPRPERGLSIHTDAGAWVRCPYPELAARARSFAGRLIDREVPAGAVISLLASDPLEFVIAFAGTLLAGCTPSPIATAVAFRDAEQYAEHVAGILHGARPSLVLADRTLRPTADRAARDAGLPESVVSLDDIAATGGRSAEWRRPPAELALLQFTSGSSGHPKGVRVSRRNLERNLASIRAWLDWGPDDGVATWLPLYHDMGLIGALLTPLSVQANVWIMTPRQFLRTPERWVECFGRMGATIATAPTFGYGYVAGHVREEHLAANDLSGWRVAIVGAERIDPAAMAWFTHVMAPHGFPREALAPAYGLAEATLAVTGVRPGADAPVVRIADVGLAPGRPVEVVERGRLGIDGVGGSGWLTGCGTPVAGGRVRIVDEDGRDLPERCIGEIEVTGESVALGYRDPEGRETPFAGGTFRTGDAGFLLDGDLYVIGRLGDRMKVRGRVLHAEDVEAAVAGVPGVPPGRCAALLGSTPDADLAVVVVQSQTTGWADGVMALLRSLTADTTHLAVFQAPRGSLLRTSSGKVRRRVMWHQLGEGPHEWRLLAYAPGAGTTWRPSWALTPAGGSS